MDAATISTANFTLDNGVTGTVTYSGTTATFTPSSNLAYSTTYTATITTAAKDAAGNAMASDYAWSFTTGAATFSVATVSDPLAVQQWGLRNIGQNGYADTNGVASTGTNGTDINVDPVYSTYGHTGLGVLVAVVDSGLEIAHEDLSANVVPGGSWDFVNSDTDPTSTATDGDHGTMVSGLIAMAKNGIGGIGVAPNARLKGFNFIASQGPGDEVASLGGSTASPNSSDVFIFNQSYGYSNTTDFQIDPALEAQYAYGTGTLRGGKGALYVKSAGNGFTRVGNVDCTPFSIGVSCQNANFDPSNTLPYQIVMAAMNAKGKKSSYSTAGSAIWASTPGGETGYNSQAITDAGYVAPPAGSVIYDPAMVTTDQSGCAAGQSVNTPPTGYGPFSYFNWGGAYVGSINANCNYTNGMNGTSSAAPMMSGVIALILEANPALTWREVKDILAKTAVQVDASNPGVTVTAGMTGASVATPYVAELPWTQNTAGFWFHNWYGFGAVNASAAVNMARTYVSGSLGTFANTGWIDSGTLALAIPDNNVAGASTTLAVPAIGVSNFVEVVQIQVTTTGDAGGGWTGDIAIELTAPSGTKSILKNIKDGFDGTNLAGMVLASNAFYGEPSTGNWTVKLVDGWTPDTQTLTNVKIRVYGH
jgi:subtilisin family serine protease/subtilisin-like proprotein convertase family protein